FDSALVFTAQWFRLGGGVVHPLTRRYNSFVSFIVTQLSLKPFENGLLVVTAAAAFVRPYRTNN
uniref:hypothetical protein n=1 Tax=Vibrio atypicus TaxID=558271 RepID=UPI0037366AE0